MEGRREEDIESGVKGDCAMRKARKKRENEVNKVEEK